MAIKDLRSDNAFFRGVVWPERPNVIADLSYPPVRYARLNRASRDGQPDVLREPWRAAGLF